jgi:hypothetical protein
MQRKKRGARRVSRYVVAVKRERRASGAKASLVCEVPGVNMLSDENALRAIIEAPESAAEEIRQRFKDDLVIEPEILHHTK